MSKNNELKNLGDFINGKWVTPSDHSESWEIFSPADLKDKIISPKGHFKNIDIACEAAKAAYLKWAQSSLDERKEYFVKLKKVFASHADEMAQLISREVGKPLWESKTESAALSSKIDITLEHSLKLVADEKVSAALPGVDGFIRYKPRGVMAVIGPFNFPAHLPNGHIVPALITGNTVVFKPSDKTSAVGQLYSQCFEEAGFPPGVFNLIQGQGEIGKRLVQHELVDGVLFTGSYEVGLNIKKDTMDHYWKLLALEMGGKNSSVIWNDAEIDKAVYETIVGAYMTSGQRCSCTSKVILHKDVYDEFLDKFHKIAKKIKVGHWSENPFMGPLISQASVEKYTRFQEIAKREGAESLMRGKVLSVGHEGYYVSPSINLVSKFSKDSVYQKNEIFGPNVAVYKVDDFDKSLEIVNDAGFGLVMALFSKNKKLYEKAILEARVGLLNWNRTTNGASSRIPFGGINKSGNDRPSGHFAVQYCTIPIGSLEDMGAFDRSKVLPGIQVDDIL